MIVKFHARGGGGGKGPTGYLLGRDYDREGATLLRGDPDEVAALIDSSRYAKKYTSGVLSFAESNLPDKQKRALMDSFEKTLLPGMEAQQYSCLWVEHRDKGRLELNFVIPNLELTSGKRLQPYYHAADMRRVEAWATIQRDELKLADPHDPARRRALVTPRDLPPDRQQAAEQVTNGLLAMAEQGQIKTRADVVQTLTDAGFTVARETKSSISLADPDGGRNLRLKGALYERDFRLGPELRAEIDRASFDYAKGREQRVSEARGELARGIEIKRAELEKRHPRQPEAAQEHRAEQLEVDIHHPDAAGLERGGDGRRDRLDDRQQHHEDTGPERHLEPAGDARRTAGGAGRTGREEVPVSHTAEGPDIGGPLPVRGQADSTDRGQVNDGDRAGAVERIRELAERARQAGQELAERAREATERFYANCKRLAKAAGELERTERTAERNHQQLERAGSQLEQWCGDFAHEAESVNGARLRTQVMLDNAPARQRLQQGYDRSGPSRGGGGMEM